MSLEIGKPYEQVDNWLFKKWGLFDAIFGNKMQELLDKVSSMFGTKSGVTTHDVFKPTEIWTVAGTKVATEVIKNAPISVNKLWDMTHLADKYKNQARAKNNNPSWITWNEKFANPTPWSNAYAFQEAGIQYVKGTPRPKRERIKKNGELIPTYYVKFLTMDDGLRAKKIMLERSTTSIRNRLAKRVWHTDQASNYRYADGILRDAWIDGNKRFSELSESQKDMLMMKQIKQESGGLYKELLARNVTPIASNIA